MATGPTTDVLEARRTRTLTEPAHEHYELSLSRFKKRLAASWDSVQTELDNVMSVSDDDIDQLKKANLALTLAYGGYRMVSIEFLAYLDTINSVESQHEMSQHKKDAQRYDFLVTSVLDRLDLRIRAPDIDAKSIRSNRSAHSLVSHHSKLSSSSSSSDAARKRAKAEAAKARVAYLEREAALRKKQALLEEEEKFNLAKVERRRQELHVDLEVLREHKQCAEAEAEADALEKISTVGTIPEQIEDPSVRTAKYIQEHCNTHSASHDCYSQHSNESCNMSRSEIRNQTPSSTPDKPVLLNPQAKSFEPSKRTVTSELSQFLLKKDLLFSRLHKFDDSPENYSAWKTSFCSIMDELDVTHAEELDLLVRWLGPESTKHAISLRAANSSNPSKGLLRLWERLNDRYGSPQMVESALKKKLNNFPKLATKDHSKLYELSDILSEIESAMDDLKYRDLLSYFNTTSGINPVVSKLPFNIQEKWTNHAVRYQKLCNVVFPPFSVFADFVRDISRIKNNPGFMYDNTMVKDNGPSKQVKSSSAASGQQQHRKGRATVMKTDVSPQHKATVDNSTRSSTDISSKQHRDNNSTFVKEDKFCPHHNVGGHDLGSCRSFLAKPISVRKKFVRDKNICFNCCESSNHRANACNKEVRCERCGSRHATALHFEPPMRKDGGEEVSPVKQTDKSDEVINACSQVCGKMSSGKSCAKVVCVRIYAKERPEEKVKMYALIDDQSNRSLVKPEFFQRFSGNYQQVGYSLSSCAGTIDTSGRRAIGFVVETLDGATSHDLPPLTECRQIPDIRHEIPTPSAALSHPHLRDIAKLIPSLDADAPILLLLGRDLIEAHHISDQRIGPRGSPYGQKLSLGWVIVGETCLGRVHTPDEVNVNKTYIYPGERASIFPPCGSQFKLKDRLDTTGDNLDALDKDIFCYTSKDDKIGQSVEDKDFLNIMSKEFTKTPEGNWSAPLPFRLPRSKMPSNRMYALKRARNLEAGLKKNPDKREHFFEFMGKILANRHAELAPPLDTDEECWFLPIFGVYHKKKGQIRIVFDSSATFQGVSLNSVLLQGPDLSNSLLGILMRFRKEHIAITADIQQMFFQFRVHEEDRNFLRFFWFKDNNPDMELAEYRMCAHVFGNSPSPAIATYGLRKSAIEQEGRFGSDMREFVEKNFYVDDGLVSFEDGAQAVDLLKRTQEALASGGNLRLHKIASNNSEVMKAFPKEDLATELKDLDIGMEHLPLQRSLGLTWNLNTDCFTFNVSNDDKPFTRRGVLSVVNSLYDPLGFIAPIVVQGRILMRDLVTETLDWDLPLSDESLHVWNVWRDSLKCLEQLSIPRTYLPTSFTKANPREIHIFGDASEQAISAVAYVRTVNDESADIGFVLGKAKVAPKGTHTIPRLELCAALLAVELGEIVSCQLDLPITDMKFYSDSRVVLGYLNNQVRRFYVYVENRVSRILRSTTRQQWNYVASEDNPADQGTRPIVSSTLGDSKWLNGPEFLRSMESADEEKQVFDLQAPDQDKEIRSAVQCVKTDIGQTTQIWTSRFEKFSDWTRLVKAVAVLKKTIRLYMSGNKPKFLVGNDLDFIKEASEFIIREVQHYFFSAELECLTSNRPLPGNSTVLSLNPFIDQSGILRVGGRLLNAREFSFQEKHPIILPARTHVSKLLVEHHHAEIKHQGLHMTEGAIRSRGYWLIGGKRLIRSVIYQCVKCKKLRGRSCTQIMSALPEDRVTPGPPFSSVGVDAFGPWNVVARRTRGGVSQNKRWAILYACLTTRAIHIEIVEELSTSSFINATRRFIAIRGPVSEFRSDRGTNFIGATDHMNIQAINVEDKQLANFLKHNSTVWIFNSPHSSHMGGAWERLIGVVRRVLDSMLAEHSTGLTHEVLTTFMAEVSSIVNSRPLVPVSTDPDNPMVLSPMMLLTQKSGERGTYLTEGTLKDMYKAQWRRVQCLSDIFWKRWKSEFLQTLQQRRKWMSTRRDLQKGDVVLVIEEDTCRNDWPLGIVVDVYPSKDDRVRKVGVKLCRRGERDCKIYTRPVTKLITLVENEEKCG
ncbi:uncharacterized protein LOC117338425 [Pecten maximus]|uniref:uncharacterized protein LOC117338425 n=1 Tax=Pecten maximus TaxID=6579 RepID=UPI0014585D47|nr:uncharacterized protein LOC117338425 [Pecten maximus]